MADPTDGVDRSDAPYVVVSSDTHAGLPVDEYREFLEASVHAEFDEWLATGTSTARWSRRSTATT
jgi:hypothetical protein